MGSGAKPGSRGTTKITPKINPRRLRDGPKTALNKITFPGAQKTIKNQSKIIPKLKSRWEGLLRRICSPFYMFFSSPRRSRHPQNASPKTPRWLPRRCQDASQTSKKLPRSLQDRPRCLQDGPRRAQDAPRGLQEPPRPPK